MQPQNIYQPRSNVHQRSVGNGWRTLTIAQRYLFGSVIVMSILICMIIAWRDSALGWLFCALALSNAGLWWLQYRDPQPQFSTTPLSDLQVHNGKVWIGQQALPDNITKLVLGISSAQGPAFLQLPWNHGYQWLFAINELPQVRQFLQQNLPQVQIIEE